jgi:Chs5-Arf1p-binding protein BUD7/BCH1
LKGEKHAISNTTGVWQETHVSGIIRAILDDQNKPGIPPLLGLRKLDPLPTIKSEKRFLEAAAAEFFKGWQLGSSVEVQVPTLTSNHLTVAIIKYFEESGRLKDAAAFFEPLFNEDLEVGPVLASCYIGCGIYFIIIR